jgi:hypothetical protein
MRRRGVKSFETTPVHWQWLSVLVAVGALHGCTSSPPKQQVTESAVSESAPESTTEPVKDLMGEWCYIKKRRVTKYTVKEGKLHIRSGRSGQLHEADLTCNDAYTVCEAKTMRGWGTPVTETLRLDGDKMNLTRVWGGAWKDKTYNFTYTRCPKW